VEDVMAKELEMNDKTAQNQERHSSDKRNQQKLQGKALQMNENSAEDREAARSPVSPQQSGDKRNQQKLQGKALQVNENSVDDREPPGHRRQSENDRGGKNPR
jgi:hypothetical protein